MKTKGRIIFHIDMNSFYASVEIANHPELNGLPLAIAGRPEERHGIVVTSSYEARKRGVRTTMTVREARQLCPDLIVRHPDFPLYRRTSEQLFAMLKEYTPLVEKASIDEGYLDVSAVSMRQPLHLAGAIQRRIGRELLLPCSIGVAPNKFLAKMASNLKKPMGLTVLRKRDLAEKLWPLPIGKIHGVGPSTERKLIASGIRTVGALARQDVAWMDQRFGKNGRRLHEMVNGIDDRPVDPEAWDRYKSIGHSVTLPGDTHALDVIRRTLHDLAEKIAVRLKKEHVVGYELVLTMRYYDWKTITRHKKTAQPLRTAQEIEALAYAVFQANWKGRDIRLLGITLASFQSAGEMTKQLDLFSYQQDVQAEKLLDIVDQINDHFGENALLPAVRLLNQQRNSGSGNDGFSSHA